MWFAIISFIVVIIGLFFFSKFRMERKIRTGGGMAVKYEKLLNLIKEDEPRCKIYKETPSYINIGYSNYSGSTLIEILATFSTVTITYRTRGKFFGDHKLQWDFQADGDQEYMIHKMNKDISAYFDKINLEDNLKKNIDDYLDKNIDDLLDDVDY